MSVDLGSAHGSLVLDSAGVTRGVQAAERALATFEQSVARSAQTLTQIETAGGRVAVSLERAGAESAAAFGQIDTAAARSATAVGQISKSAASTDAALGKLSTAATVMGGALVAGVGVAVKTATDFEHQIDAVGAVSGATAQQIGQLSDLAVKLGNDITLSGVSASDAAQAMEALAKAGVSVQDQLAGAAKGALLLASAGGMKDFGQAAEIAANAMTVFGKSGQDIPHIADLMAAAANASTIEVTDLGLSLRQGGQVAAQFGQSIESTVGVLAAFGASGLRASDAGTSLKQMMLSLAAPTKQAQAVMQQYGLSFFDAEGHMKSFADIAETLKTHLSGLTDQQRAAALQIIFGSDAIRAADVFYQQGAAGIDKWTAAVNQSGSAAELGKARNDNLAGSIQQLKGSVESAEIALGKFVIPDLKLGVDKITGLVNAFNGLPAPLQQAATYSTLAVGSLLLLAGAGTKVVQGFTALKVAADAVAAAMVRKEAAELAAAEGDTVAAASANNAAFALTKLGAGVGIAGLAILTANEAAQAFAGESLPDLIISVLKYGDAWGKGRDEAQQAFQATQGDLVATQQQIDATIAKIEDLKKHANDPSFGKFFRDLFAGNVAGSDLPDPQIQQQTEKLRVLRLLQAGFLVDDSGHLITGTVRNNTTGTDLKQTADSAAQAAAANDTLSSSYREAQKAAEALAQSNQEAANRAAGIGTAWASIGDAVAAEQQAAQAGDVLSRSMLVAKQSAIDTAAALIQLGEQQQVADTLKANADAMSALNAQTGPLQAALDQINAKRAAGIPLTAQETSLLTQIPGALAGATTAYDALTLAQADQVLQQQRLAGSSGQAGAGFSTLQGTAGALQSQLDALRASAIALDGALGALGNENSKLGAEYDILGQRIDVLNAKKKEQGGLNAADQAELDRLTAAQKVLGDQMGENAAKQRDLVLAQIANAGATQQAAAAQQQLAAGLAQVNPDLGQAADGLVGMTDGMGQVATASGNAVAALGAATATALAAGNAAQAAGQQTDVYHAALDRIPPGVSTTVDTPGLQTAIDGVGLLQGAIDNTPRSFTVTAQVDISEAEFAIQTLNRELPHSPAKEGPFSTLPNWDALFDIEPAGARGAVLMRQATEQLAGALDTGMDAAQQDAAKKAADLLSAISSAVKAGQDALEGLANFRLDPHAVANGQAVIGALRPLIDQFVADAQAFEDGALDAGSKVASAASSAASAVKAGVDALTGLDTFVAPAPAKVAAFLTSLVGVVQRLTEIAALLGGDGVAAAAQFSDNATKIVNLLGPGVSGMSALTDFKVPSDKQMLVFGERLLRVIVRIGEIGNLLETQGVEDAAKFASDSTTIVNLLRPGAEGFTALTDFKVPSDEQIKVFGERLLTIIVRVGEVGNLLETDGVERAGKFAEGAGKVTGILSAATGFNDLANLQPVSTAQIDQFVAGTRELVSRLADAASQIGGDAVAQAGKYGENGAKAVSLVGSTLSAFKDLQDFVAPSREAIDGIVSLTGVMADDLAQVAGRFSPDTLDKLGAFGDDAGKAFSALQTALSAAKGIEDQQGVPAPADVANTVLGRFNDGLGPLRALSTVAQEWATRGAGIRANLTQAFADLGLANALAQGAPGSLAAAQGVPVVSRREVAVTLIMPADDGAFVARSLRIDGKSRHDVADMIAGEIANAAA